MADQPRTMYYQAREDLTVNGLPIFLGYVEIQDGEVRGKHYRAGIDQIAQSYMIGYYWLEQEADQFLQKLRVHGDIEISTDEFEALLSQWTQQGQNPPFCWNPHEIAEQDY